MKEWSALAESILNSLGHEGHIPASEGDIVGEDGYVRCGKCGERREYMLPSGRYVPSLCRCGRVRRAQMEYEQAKAKAMEYIDEIAGYNMIYTAKLRSATFEASKQREEGEAPFEIAKKYVRDFDAICAGESDMKGLLLYGPVGTGKTHLAACVCNALLAQKTPVLFINIARLTDLSFDEQREVTAHMNGAQLLVLDDLGAERNTGFKTETVYNIIDARSNAMKPMIVTTNKTPEEMRNDADLPYRRIWERVGSMCRPVRMNGESWRKARTVEALRKLKESG